VSFCARTLAAPAEMLQLKMDLDGDLGIDSIKRVEILSAMREREPNLPEVDAGAMAQLRTLGQIVESMGSFSPPPPQEGEVARSAGGGGAGQPPAPAGGGGGGERRGGGRCGPAHDRPHRAPDVRRRRQDRLPGGDAPALD